MAISCNTEIPIKTTTFSKDDIKTITKKPYRNDGAFNSF